MMRAFVALNVRWSNAFDRLLPEELTVDGNSDFKNSFVGDWLRPGMRVIDIGGGKNPFISVERKRALGIHVTGIDIAAGELARAPEGAYDQTVCADIARYRGEPMADLCICQAVLEHVRDVESAFQAIAGMLKPGGVALIFVPSRNAVFARLNLLLPEAWKRRILFAIFPGASRDQGFPSYYNRCTPKQFGALARDVGLEVEQAKYYFVSSYFTFFVPLHLLWRLWMAVFRATAGNQAAETFSMALRKVR